MMMPQAPYSLPCKLHYTTTVYVQILLGHLFHKFPVGEGGFCNFIFTTQQFCIKRSGNMWLTTVAIAQQPKKYLCIYQVICLAIVASEKHC